MIAIVLAVLIPAAAAVLGLALGRSRLAAQLVACAGAAATLGAATIAALDAWGGPASTRVWGSVETGWVPFTLSTRLDGLTATVAIMVATVALCVQVYSTAYLRREGRYGSYAALVSLFTAAMLLVVVADDLVVLLVGWEVMGICSYFLVGHYWEQAWARAAAVKAFVVTRVGDVGLLIGIIMLGEAFGTLRISGLTSAAAGCVDGASGCPVGSSTLTVAGLLVLAGVVGKSAQAPLHVWLPDAMAGPTPISALIHAATMVAAGVFLVARLLIVLQAAPAVLVVLAVLASVTMLGAALAALAQDDLKRVLAYSTSSQLAYMLGGLAVGGYGGSLFHLLGHAAFKALLFLAAGSVIHAVGSNYLRDMGGLRTRMPVTYVTMTLGFLALAGVPPLVGFVGKESVLTAAEHAVVEGGPLPRWAALMVLLAGLLTVLVTAAYVMRAWLLTFHGRGAPATAAAHEAPWLMRLPLLVLAVPTIALGGVALRGAWLERALDGGSEPAGSGAHLEVSIVTAGLSLGLVLAGLALTWAEWARIERADPAATLARARGVLADGFGVDRLYALTITGPVAAAARQVVAADRDVVHAGVLGVGRTAGAAGTLARWAQSGRVQAYLTVVLSAAVLLGVAGMVAT